MPERSQQTDQHPSTQQILVLVADIIGSSKLADALSEREYRQLISEFQSVCRAEYKRVSSKNRSNSRKGFYPDLQDLAERQHSLGDEFIYTVTFPIYDKPSDFRNAATLALQQLVQIARAIKIRW